jgi:hypothetical protein
MLADNFVKLLMVQYALAALAYGWAGQGWKMCYFVGALLISLAVLKMR